MIYLVSYSFKLQLSQHSRLSLVLCLLLLVTYSAIPQTPKAIYGEFEKEMAEYGIGSTDTSLLPTSLSPIPAWMNRSFPMHGDTLFVFGISDPGLADSTARQQAFYRATAIGALANGTGCEHFSDLYNQGKAGGSESKYEEIYRFIADFSDSISAPAILNSAILPSSEAILLLGIPIKNPEVQQIKPIRIEAVLYNNESDIMNGNRMSTKVDITIQKKNADKLLIMDASSFYQINGKATGMRCLYPQSQAVYNRYEFYYATGIPVDEADSTNIRGTTCKQGLWIAYASQILEHLSLQAKMISKDSQIVRDNTKMTSNELIREKSRTKLMWRIKNIDMNNHRMKVNMTISEFKTSQK
ncbi:MAG: hypothetical protein WCM93_13310 [Bacteroidota bacterium]